MFQLIFLDFGTDSTSTSTLLPANPDITFLKPGKEHEKKSLTVLAEHLKGRVRVLEQAWLTLDSQDAPGRQPDAILTMINSTMKGEHAQLGEILACLAKVEKTPPIKVLPAFLLQVAISNVQPICVKKLVADLNMKEALGLVFNERYISLAVAAGSYYLVDFLAGHELCKVHELISLESVNEEKQNALELAVERGNLEMVKFLTRITKDTSGAQELATETKSGGKIKQFLDTYATRKADIFT